jgi:uncharacterized protein YecT (DUF1311 family)
VREDASGAIMRGGPMRRMVQAKGGFFVLRRGFVFLALVVASVTAPGRDSTAGQAKPEAACDMDKASSQADMNGCSYANYEAADKKMNALYQRQMERLSKGSQRTLRDSQRAWLKYRDAAYSYEVEWAGPCQGTICPLLRNQSLLKLTEQRIATLQNYVDCTEGGCPK